MSYYLKCQYSEEGPLVVMPWEYVITFRCNEKRNPSVLLPDGEWPKRDEEWCLVNREDVVPRADSSGLVKLIGLRIEEDKNRALIEIYNSPDSKTDIFNVPLNEIEVRA